MGHVDEPMDRYPRALRGGGGRRSRKRRVPYEKNQEMLRGRCEASFLSYRQAFQVRAYMDEKWRGEAVSAVF